jgi:hypothetical protein
VGRQAVGQVGSSVWEDGPLPSEEDCSFEGMEGDLCPNKDLNNSQEALVITARPHAPWGEPIGKGCPCPWLAYPVGI